MLTFICSRRDEPLSRADKQAMVRIGRFVGGGRGGGGDLCGGGFSEGVLPDVEMFRNNAL